MAIRVVQDVPRSAAGRRMLRGLAVTLGVLLVFVGALATAIPLLFLVPLVLLLLQGETPSSGLHTDDVVVLAIGVGLVVVGFGVGLRLIRGRRRVGLFLRKFGLQDTTRTVSVALASAIGRSLRLVTLDDAMVAAIGVSRSRRRIAWWAWLLGFAVVAVLVWWVVGGGFDAASQGVADDAFSGVGGDTPTEAAGSIIGATVGAAVGLILLLLLVVVVLAVATVLAVLGGGSYLSARGAERAATRSITTPAAVEPTARSVARRGRKIFGARLVVVAVATAYWQQAVQALAGVSDLVVIDVSQPTENLLWEVARMRSQFGDRWVLVGAYSQVAPLADGHRPPPGSPSDRLAQLLDGEQILAYGTGPGDQARFTRALRGRLDQVRRR